MSEVVQILDTALTEIKDARGLREVKMSKSSSPDFDMYGQIAVTGITSKEDWSDAKVLLGSPGGYFWTIQIVPTKSYSNSPVFSKDFINRNQAMQIAKSLPNEVSYSGLKRLGFKPGFDFM